MARPTPLGKGIDDDRLVLLDSRVKVGFAASCQSGRGAAAGKQDAHLFSSWTVRAVAVAWNRRGRLVVVVAGDDTAGRDRSSVRWKARKEDMAGEGGKSRATSCVLRCCHSLLAEKWTGTPAVFFFVGQ